jgi:hypothetical protein
MRCLAGVKKELNSTFLGSCTVSFAQDSSNALWPDFNACIAVTLTVNGNLSHIIIIIITRFSCLEARCVCRQAAVKAAKILPLVVLAKSKQDPINRGHGAQYLYRPPPAGGRDISHIQPGIYTTYEKEAFRPCRIGWTQKI